MKLNELLVSKNRHLTIFEKNKIKKIFDDKAKRMPDDLRQRLSDVEILEVDDNVGLTTIVLDIGKTEEELSKERTESAKHAKQALTRIQLASGMMLSALGGGIYYR